MVATAEHPGMARAKGRPKRSERDDVTVKVDRTLVGKAKLIATHRGISVAELFTEALRELEAGQGRGAK
jgi:hypothetical protein